MATLPTPDGCGRPATRRVEVYSSTTIHAYASLDGAVNTCADHEAPAKATIRAAGFTPFSMPLTDSPVVCGSGVDFTGATARVWSPEPAELPSRCATCAGEIEYVPTPAGADPTGCPPYWRHVGLIGDRPHGARPVAS